MKKKLTFILGGASAGLLVLVFLMTLPVLADNGPHVPGRPSLGSGCAGCHRAHTAQADNLLKEAQPALCYSCHGLTGQGAQADVEGGVWYDTTAHDLPATALRGGGFSYALIDSADGSNLKPNGSIGVLTYSTREVATSAHSVDGTATTMWGNGAIGSGAGKANVNLTCGSCHDPHGNGNYRILRAVPNDSGAAVGVAIADATVKDYATTDYWSVKDTNQADFIGKISSWCSTCHTRYKAASFGASGDSIFSYRHKSDGTVDDGTKSSYSCVKCHVAHGSNAVVTDSAAHVGLPGQPLDNPNENLSDSRLLRLNDRGVCVMCHDK